MPRCLFVFFVLLLTPAARAVIVRGRVTDGLGHPLPGSRVQLIQLSGGTRNATSSICGVDGSYELRSELSGRFLLLTSPSLVETRLAPQIGEPFYGGRTDLLRFDIALNARSVSPEQSAQLSLLETPLAQLAERPAPIAADELVTEATAVPVLRLLAGAYVVQLGQVGQPAQLFVRGAIVNRTELDGVPIEGLGGKFDFGALGSSGLAGPSPMTAVEVIAGANPVHGIDADAGLVSLYTARATTERPVLVYQGDAGNLSTMRNEGTFSVAHARADALFSFARFDTDNDLPASRLHLVSSASNLGYHISGNTSLRLTLRRDVAATPLPSPYEFFLVSPSGRRATQNLYGSFLFETQTAHGWHNLLRYGLVRERQQSLLYGTPATGQPVAIRAANGISAAGRATFLPRPPREDEVSDRDEGSFATDYEFRHGVRGLLLVRYEDERGAASGLLTADERLERRHFSVAGSLQAKFRHRVFAEASGFIDQSAALGLHGAPRAGLTYVPMRPGTRLFRGTSLRFTAATGVREPSTIEAALLPEAVSPRSRTFSAGVEQEIVPRRLRLRATYFHGQFSHAFETVNLLPLAASNALAYRAQGLESEMVFQPTGRLELSGGYTYLASLVEQSAAVAVANPNLPGVAIGATTALKGSRPFERPPNTGFVRAEYAGTHFDASFKGRLAGRADDTTALVLNPTLLLPNRNLSPGYASLDASFGYNLTRAVRLYTELTNLADSRHIAPIGYLSTPFAARVGLRLRIGRE